MARGKDISPHIFHSKLMRWYHCEPQRKMPWLREKDPYKIWISEIMLQQTTVQQVKPYYYRFLESFPTVDTLANASEDQVLHLWQGLGYNSRARNLLHAAKTIVSEHNGKFPNNYDDIIKLKGIGDYTASAISAFAYEAPYYVIDTNVKRLYSRLFDINHPIINLSKKKEIKDFLSEAGKNEQASDFNQALLNFGAEICKDKNPSCLYCTFHDECKSRIRGVQHLRPVKAIKKERKKRIFHYFVFHQDQAIGIKKRVKSDIWQGLYEFIKHENKKSESLEWREILALFPEMNLPTIKPEHYKVTRKTQTLTHQYITAFIYYIPFLPDNLEAEIIDVSHIQSYAFPGILRNYIKDEDYFLS